MLRGRRLPPARAVSRVDLRGTLDSNACSTWDDAGVPPGSKRAAPVSVGTLVPRVTTGYKLLIPSGSRYQRSLRAIGCREVEMCTLDRASAESNFRFRKRACAKERRSPGRRRGIAGAELMTDPEVTFGSRYRSPRTESGQIAIAKRLGKQKREHMDFQSAAFLREIDSHTICPHLRDGGIFGGEWLRRESYRTTCRVLPIIIGCATPRSPRLQKAPYMPRNAYVSARICVESFERMSHQNARCSTINVPQFSRHWPNLPGGASSPRSSTPPRPSKSFQTI